MEITQLTENLFVPRMSDNLNKYFLGQCLRKKTCWILLFPVGQEPLVVFKIRHNHFTASLRNTQCFCIALVVQGTSCFYCQDACCLKPAVVWIHSVCEELALKLSPEGHVLEYLSCFSDFKQVSLLRNIYNIFAGIIGDCEDSNRTWSFLRRSS